MQRDEEVLTETGIRRLRAKPVFVTPNVFPPERRRADDADEPPARPRTGDEQHCYVCKRKYVEIHHFYDQLCPACADAQLRQAHRDRRPRAAGWRCSPAAG